MQASLIGQVIDEKYKILSLLGAGGMGEVYRAEHLRLQRPVAIKVLRAAVASESVGDEPLRRFEREAKTACRIDHPHAVSVFDYGVVGTTPYLVMNLVEGVSLKRRIREQGRLPHETVLTILEQVASALHQAHSIGIVHRDLKPENIVLEQQADGQLRALVLDFGLAKIVSESLSGSSLSNTGEALGTPLYMSPEQVQGRESSKASDIYSLGVLAFELLAGDVPFRAEQAMSVMYKHLNEQPPLLRDVDQNFPDSPEVEAVVRRALAKSPQERFRSAPEFVQRLRIALTGDSSRFAEGLAADADEFTRATPNRLPLVGGVAVLAVAALAGGVAVVAGRMNTAPAAIESVSLATSTLIPRATEAPVASASREAGAGQTLVTEKPLPIDTAAAGVLTEAELLIDQGKLQDARTLLESRQSTESGNAEFHFVQAKLFQKLRQPIRAIESLKRALELDPTNSRYQAARAAVIEAIPKRNLSQVREGNAQRFPNRRDPRQPSGLRKEFPQAEPRAQTGR